MYNLLSKLVNKTSKYEIIFRLASGNKEVFYSEDGDIELMNCAEFIYFTNKDDTIIINVKQVESIEFNPIY